MVVQGSWRFGVGGAMASLEAALAVGAASGRTRWRQIGGVKKVILLGNIQGVVALLIFCCQFSSKEKNKHTHTHREHTNKRIVTAGVKYDVRNEKKKKTQSNNNCSGAR